MSGNRSRARKGLALTEAEYRTLRLTARLDSRKQVAAQLGVGITTVRLHLWSAYNKLGADGLVEALRLIGWLRVPNDDGEYEFVSLRARLEGIKAEVEALLARFRRARVIA